MKTLICLENLSYSAFNYEVGNEVNKHVLNSHNEICVTTFDETMPFMDINTAVYRSNELDSFNNGVMISHQINHAKSLLGCKNSSKKVLYLYDLDWMFQPIFYHDIYNVLTNEELFLILRSKDYMCPVKNLCNREPDAIISRFSLEEIWNSL